MTPEHRADRIKQRALALGFDAAGITDLRPPPHADVLRQWLGAGMAGTMRYMQRQASRRTNPSRIVPGGTRAIVVTKGYFQRDPPGEPGRGRIAKYARGQDYHEALCGPLEELAAFIRSLGNPETIAKWYVDHGPVPERELAQRAGLGWIGKNTMLIDPERGSYCFLAAVLTNLDVATDLPFEADRCGTCTRCLDACPTNAFPSARVLDSRRCISYLTIEHRGEIDPELHAGMGDWIFGCDVCQEVCPWNIKFAATSDGADLGHDPTLATVDLKELVAISNPEFARRYGSTALDRTGVDGLRRNARIAWHNSQRGFPWRTSPMP